MTKPAKAKKKATIRGARRGDWCLVHVNRTTWRLAKVAGTKDKVATSYRWRGGVVARPPSQVILLIPKGTEASAAERLGRPLAEDVIDWPEPAPVRCSHLKCHWALDGMFSVLTCQRCGHERDRVHRDRHRELWDRLRRKGLGETGTEQFLRAQGREM